MVIFETPASAAMASTLARSRPRALKWLCAASTMRRTRSGSRGLPRRGGDSTCFSAWGIGVFMYLTVQYMPLYFVDSQVHYMKPFMALHPTFQVESEIAMSTDQKQQAQRVAIVTGAATGIGEATARA